MQEDLRAHITMNIPIDQRLFFTTTLSLVESLHAAKAKSGLQLRYLVQTIANQLFFFFLGEISHLPAVEHGHCYEGILSVQM